MAEHAYRGSDTFARLRALKRPWDPDDVFRVDHDIPPEGGVNGP